MKEYIDLNRTFEKIDVSSLSEKEVSYDNLASDGIAVTWDLLNGSDLYLMSELPDDENIIDYNSNYIWLKDKQQLFYIEVNGPIEVEIVDLDKFKSVLQATEKQYLSAEKVNEYITLNTRHTPLSNKIIIILAKAGSGKTMEFMNRTRLLRDQNQRAFFIDISSLVKLNFEESIGIRNIQEFNNWKESEGLGYFFLDSVDEAKLNDPKDFYIAIRKFSNAIHEHIKRACIYISSRPAEWQANHDRYQIQKLFELPISVQIFRLNTLTRDQIKKYADFIKVKNIEKFMQELEREDIEEFMKQPQVIAEYYNPKTGEVLESQVLRIDEIKKPVIIKDLGYLHEEQIALIKSIQDFKLRYETLLLNQETDCPTCGSKTKSNGSRQSNFHAALTDHKIKIKKRHCHCGRKIQECHLQ